VRRAEDGAALALQVEDRSVRPGRFSVMPVTERRQRGQPCDDRDLLRAVSRRNVGLGVADRGMGVPPRRTEGVTDGAEDGTPFAMLSPGATR
jgi:hypothetical protein